MDAIQLVTETHRREILRLVWDNELSAGELADKFDLSFGAVSQHLGKLRDAGFVNVRRDGNHRFYRADQNTLAPYEPMLRAMWGALLDNLIREVEKPNA